jgi:hypothetical protein
MFRIEAEEVYDRTATQRKRFLFRGSGIEQEKCMTASQRTVDVARGSPV